MAEIAFCGLKLIIVIQKKLVGMRPNFKLIYFVCYFPINPGIDKAFGEYLGFS